jgi:hypothetical protein
MKLSCSTGLAAGLLALAAAPALAAPVTVELRVEGATRTLFEGPVTTDVRPFVADDGPHECDGPASAPAPGVTRGAIMSAAPLAYKATWSVPQGSPTFTEIAGENVDYEPATGRFLAEYYNGSFAMAGSCDDIVTQGSKVLFAFADGTETLLALSGPSSAKPGEAVTLKVTDAGSGAAVAGATVGGSVSAADGTVTVGPFSTRGDHDLKATKDKSIRSNRVRVCVSDGADGACGTVSSPAAKPGVVPDVAPPAARFRGLSDRQVLSRGPRELRGSFADASGVKTVKLRLTKRLGKKCWYFSGRSERFRGTRCGKGAYFAITAGADWSYLLPARLGRGRYVLDAVAVDGAGNRTPLARDATRVVFTVR